MFLVNAEEMRALDRQTIEELGIPSIALMEVAGREVAKEVRNRARLYARVTVLAGHGHNGGDGLVAARHLAGAGYPTTVCLVGQMDRMSPEVATLWRACERLGLSPMVYEGDDDQLKQQLEQTDVLIDALLGTGIKGDVRPAMQRVIRQVNDADLPLVVSVDVPSGVDTDTGAIRGAAIRAHCTVTFQFPKWCHYLAPAAELAGECVVADIGIPSTFASRYPIRSFVTDKHLWHDALKPRPPFAHKGTFGHVLVIGGSRGMAGAPSLTAHAALKTGAGRVTVAVPRGIQDVVSGYLAEGMTWGLGEAGTGTWSADSAIQIVERLRQYDVLAVGPGLGRFAGDVKWLQTILGAARVPVVLDADALNVLSANINALNSCRAPVVLTPHPGEMARLLKADVRQVEENRPQVAKQLAAQTGAVVVLKGRYTLTAFPDGDIYVNPTGTPAMAKGGSGDVLTGVIAGLLAQNVAKEIAVPLGVYVHGYAGQLAAQNDSEFSVLARDLSNCIGPALRSAASNE